MTSDYVIVRKEDVEDFEETSQNAPLRQSNWCQWKPTSQNHLIVAETKMLEYVKCPLEKKYVKLASGNQLWTVIANKNVSSKTPLVMVHGFGGGIGLWALNLEALSKNRAVYAFDLLGFGRSSRPKFKKIPELAEEAFIESIEEWRKALELDKIILLGHSFGGYLASSYTLKYPDSVEKLLLIDPWGFPLLDPDVGRQIPLWIRVVIRLLSPFNPLAAIRAAGPLGPNLIKRFRSDFRARYSEISEKDRNAVFEYIYHCNAGSPSGESAFKKMTEFVAYAYKPMLERIDGLRNDIPLTFVYGSKTWMDTTSGYETQNLLPDNHVQVYTVRGAGHHVYADRPAMFHMIINEECEGI